MSLRLTVVGGAAAWPNAGQACSAYLVETDDLSVLVDCGSGAIQELRKHIDYVSVDAILISHCHSDHILDLVAYRYGLIYGAHMRDRRIPLWLPPNGIQRMRMLGEAFDGQGEEYQQFWNPVFDMREYDPDGTVELGELTVTFAPTQHFIECYAMRFENAAGRALGYSADTGSIEPLVPLLAGCDVAIVEATLDTYGNTPPERRGHLTPVDAGRLAMKAGVKRLLLSHLWQERPHATVVREAQQDFEGEILVATPGLILNV